MSSTEDPLAELKKHIKLHQEIHLSMLAVGDPEQLSEIIRDLFVDATADLALSIFKIRDYNFELANELAHSVLSIDVGSLSGVLKTSPARVERLGYVMELMQMLLKPGQKVTSPQDALKILERRLRMAAENPSLSEEKRNMADEQIKTLEKDEEEGKTGVEIAKEGLARIERERQEQKRRDEAEKAAGEE